MDIPPLLPLPGNLALWTAFFAWTLAQSIKFVTVFVKERHLDFSCFVRSGGMPSAHSASVAALVVSVGVMEGTGGAPFAIAMVMALIVMFDAQNVRRAAGHQAALLNQIVSELFKDHHFSRTKLKELLGHTPLEVFVGLALGMSVAFVLHVAAGGLTL